MRPAFHFTPAAGWINDPHGLRHRNGEYHAFFQYIPERTEWAADIHWGHAKGADLLSLEELPVAIFPGDGDGGIWTGSLVVDDEGMPRGSSTRRSPHGRRPHPGRHPRRTRLAHVAEGRVRRGRPGRDGRLPGSVGVPRRLTAGAWSSAAATGTDGRHSSRIAPPTSTPGPIRASRCALRPTRALPLSQNTLWECPQLFEIDGRHVLVLSVEDEGETPYVGYAVGQLGGRPLRGRELGPPVASAAATTRRPSCATSRAARRSSSGSREIRDDAAGWAGALSVPYLLALRGDELVLAPHPDLERYRSDSTGTDVAGPAADIVWAARPGAHLAIVAADGELVSLRMTEDALHVATAAESAALPVGGDVRIVLDGPIVEVSTAARRLRRPDPGIPRLHRDRRHRGRPGVPARPAGGAAPMTASPGKLARGGGRRAPGAVGVPAARPVPKRVIPSVLIFPIKDSPQWLMPVVTASVIDLVVAGGPLNQLCVLGGAGVRRARPELSDARAVDEALHGRGAPQRRRPAQRARRAPADPLDRVPHAGVGVDRAEQGRPRRREHRADAAAGDPRRARADHGHHRCDRRHRDHDAVLPAGLRADDPHRRASCAGCSRRARGGATRRSARMSRSSRAASARWRRSCPSPARTDSRRPRRPASRKAPRACAPRGTSSTCSTGASSRCRGSCCSCCRSDASSRPRGWRSPTPARSPPARSCSSRPTSGSSPAASRRCSCCGPSVRRGSSRCARSPRCWPSPTSKRTRARRSSRG